MNESSALKEEAIKKEIELAKIDPATKTLLEAIYIDEDRASSFQRFCSSREYRALFNEIFRHTGGNLDAKICEVGAGPGFLSVALAMSGFKNVSILEPNSEWTTGTGFIADTAQQHGVSIWNDLDSWYSSDELYDFIITKACVHHFDNVSKVAAEIRCKIASDGKWLMFDEYFANSTEDLFLALLDHSYVTKYRLYEWPYSAALYVDLIQLVGYKLDEVIPTRYENNYIARNNLEKVKLSKTVTAITKILIKLRMTVILFKLERFLDDCFGINRKLRLFTFPQLFVFKQQKIALPQIPSDKSPS
jgi:2-polyprenyl-3-methyl-5-hydroxy-6-metoxy-1,4-benzoquinol methylase